MAMPGKAWFGNTLPHGTGAISGRGKAELGMARQGRASRHRHGTAGNFLAGLGRARLGWARRGITSDVNGITSLFQSSKNREQT